jgi:uncharacterized protein (TIGR02466 family)
MNKNIIQIFPKSFMMKDNILTEELQKYEEFCLSNRDKTFKSNTLHVNSSYDYLPKLHQIELFKPLSNYILKTAKEYAREIGYSRERTEDCFIQSMWFNISGKGDFLFPHIHNGCLLSGVFYIKTQNENVILFHDENKNMYANPDKPTEYSKFIIPVKCIPGRLLMFPSDLNHSTPKQESEGDKIIISYNICLEERKGD